MRQGNECLRPWGPNKPNPDEVWAGRQPISNGERSTFQQTLEWKENGVRAERGGLPNTALSRQEANEIRREAVQRAMDACGFLLIRRKQLPHPLSA
jgi:hypothetical protein